MAKERIEELSDGEWKRRREQEEQDRKYKQAGPGDKLAIDFPVYREEQEKWEEEVDGRLDGHDATLAEHDQRHRKQAEQTYKLHDEMELREAAVKDLSTERDEQRQANITIVDGFAKMYDAACENELEIKRLTAENEALCVELEAAKAEHAAFKAEVMRRLAALEGRKGIDKDVLGPRRTLGIDKFPPDWPDNN